MKIKVQISKLKKVQIKVQIRAAIRDPFLCPLETRSPSATSLVRICLADEAD